MDDLEYEYIGQELSIPDCADIAMNKLANDELKEFIMSLMSELQLTTVYQFMSDYELLDQEPDEYPYSQSDLI